jgi:hypothetical protein
VRCRSPRPRSSRTDGKGDVRSPHEAGLSPPRAGQGTSAPAVVESPRGSARPARPAEPPAGRPPVSTPRRSGVSRRRDRRWARAALDTASRHRRPRDRRRPSPGPELGPGIGSSGSSTRAAASRPARPPEPDFADEWLRPLSSRGHRGPGLRERLGRHGQYCPGTCPGHLGMHPGQFGLDKHVPEILPDGVEPSEKRDHPEARAIPACQSAVPVALTVGARLAYTSINVGSLLSRAGPGPGRGPWIPGG